jgi:hypothetical protein
MKITELGATGSIRPALLSQAAGLIGTTGQRLPSTVRSNRSEPNEQRERPRGRLLTLPGTPRRHSHNCL